MRAPRLFVALYKYMSVSNLVYKITHWETWDWRIKYIPIIPFWIWHCLRARSFWFFTPSNPRLLFGGFEGETKTAIYKHLPRGSYPKSVLISSEFSFQEVERLVNQNFEYPFVVKPNIGRMGLMFRIISNSVELQLYHKSMPYDYIVQDLVEYPLEVSVFYYRFPNSKSGTITGFIRKEFLEVCGDGKSKLMELMTAYPRIRFRLDEMKAKHLENLDLVLQKGEHFVLSYALNLSRGGKHVNIEHEKDARLLKVFDDLSNHSDTLYYGRFDLKCTSLDDLKKGKNFSILEYNGCGAEPHHVYGNGYTLFQACKILAQHWNVLYEISKCNKNRGFNYMDFKSGWRNMKECRKYFSELRKADRALPVFSGANQTFTANISLNT